MQELLLQHAGEFAMAMVLMVFGYAFKGWSDTLRLSTEKLLMKLEVLVKEFHQHRIETERRVTRVETMISDIHKIKVNGDTKP
jgi:hypothetical protein